jgi:hypothetical protein
MWHGGPPWRSGGKLPGGKGDYALENKGSQEKVKKLKISLDQKLECGTLSPVESHASAMPGRFAFRADFYRSLGALNFQKPLDLTSDEKNFARPRTPAPKCLCTNGFRSNSGEKAFEEQVPSQKRVDKSRIPRSQDAKLPKRGSPEFAHAR